MRQLRKNQRIVQVLVHATSAPAQQARSGT
jgi:hypothetical protein